MKLIQYLGLVIGMAWGLFFAWGTALSTRSHLVGEGQYVLIVIALPLAVIGFIHTAINGKLFRLPILYAAGLTLLLAAEIAAYKIVFKDDGPILGRSLTAISIGFLASFGFLCIIPAIRTIWERIAEPSPPPYGSPAAGSPSGEA